MAQRGSLSVYRLLFNCQLTKPVLKGDQEDWGALHSTTVYGRGGYAKDEGRTRRALCTLERLVTWHEKGPYLVSKSG
jgi:hypothetical protein